MAKCKVTVEIQFELIEREVIVEANSESEAKILAEMQIDQSTCSDDFGEAEVSSSSARRAECIEPPSYDPDELILKPPPAKATFPLVIRSYQAIRLFLV